MKYPKKASAFFSPVERFCMDLWIPQLPFPSTVWIPDSTCLKVYIVNFGEERQPTWITFRRPLKTRSNAFMLLQTRNTKHSEFSELEIWQNTSKKGYFLCEIWDEFGRLNQLFWKDWWSTLLLSIRTDTSSSVKAEGCQKCGVGSRYYKWKESSNEHPRNMKLHRKV